MGVERIIAVANRCAADSDHADRLGAALGVPTLSVPDDATVTDADDRDVAVYDAHPSSPAATTLAGLAEPLLPAAPSIDASRPSRLLVGPCAGPSCCVISFAPAGLRAIGCCDGRWAGFTRTEPGMVSGGTITTAGTPTSMSSTAICGGSSPTRRPTSSSFVRAAVKTSSTWTAPSPA